MSNLIPHELKQPAGQLNLTEEEKIILKKIRDKKLFYIISTYTAFIAVIIYAIFNSWVDSHDRGENEISRFKRIAPFFYPAVFIILTAFFINYYLKLVHPFVKDVKQGLKEFVSFHPEKYQTPFFAEYYLVTPLKNKQRIKISKELFDAVQINSKAFISMAVHSRFVFVIDVNGRKMKFNESHALIDT